MNNNKIGMFDSGIGGLTVLKELRKILPNENYIYYADSKNNPYGEKSDSELMAIVTDIVDYLISKEVKITNALEFISLDKSPEYWATTILNSDLSRKDTKKELKDAGYFIEDTAKYLVDFYLQEREGEK